MKKLNFNIREDVKLVDDMKTNEELANAPISSGFWWSCTDEPYIFIDLLTDEETKEACYEAIEVLSELEGAVEDYVNWI